MGIAQPLAHRFVRVYRDERTCLSLSVKSVTPHTRLPTVAIRNKQLSARITPLNCALQSIQSQWPAPSFQNIRYVELLIVAADGVGSPAACPSASAFTASPIPAVRTLRAVYTTRMQAVADCSKLRIGVAEPDLAPNVLPGAAR
jgi:hypothetical protein